MLGQLTQLKIVDLSGRSVTDDDLQVLSVSCVNLESIGLDRTLVSDVGMELLVGRESLADLYFISIAETSITDRSLQLISKCCKHLIGINLRRCTDITTKGIQLLATELGQVCYFVLNAV